MTTQMTIGEKTYDLKLTTKAIVQLEKKIGCNPLLIFGADGKHFPTIGTMVAILHAGLQFDNHGITENDAYDLFDKWLDEGHDVKDFVEVIADLYISSGLIRKEKN